MPRSGAVLAAVVCSMLLQATTPARSGQSASTPNCGQWGLSGSWELQHSDGLVLTLQLSQDDNGSIAGKGILAGLAGQVRGQMRGNRFQFVVNWPGPPAARYSGAVTAEARLIDGRTEDLANPGVTSDWTSVHAATCLVPIGDTEIMATAKNDVDIYNGPGGEYDVVGMMTGGQTAKLLGSEEGWKLLELPAVPGGSGWVAEDHLSVPIKK